jgi:hypothetical protein
MLHDDKFIRPERNVLELKSARSIGRCMPKPTSVCSFQIDLGPHDGGTARVLYNPGKILAPRHLLGMYHAIRSSMASGRIESQFFIEMPKMSP